MDHYPEIVRIFLDGAQRVANAIGHAAVAGSWDKPSVLEDQLVSGLAGHLARGVWVVGEYLDLGSPDGPADFDSAAHYFAHFAIGASAADHEAIRTRGATVGAAGRDEVLSTLTTRVDALGPRLRATPVEALISVIGGKCMSLGDYLATRIVEHTVHLDDLSRSVNPETPFAASAQALTVTIEVGVAIARRRRGDTSLMEALYRRGFAERTLPVL